MNAATGSLDLAILFQDATGLLYAHHGGKEARKKMEEQRKEARQQERSMLLHRLKKAVQGVFALVIKGDDEEGEDGAVARGRREDGSNPRSLHSATREVVWSIYNIFIHGLIKTEVNEDPVWSLLRQIVASVPSLQLTLLMLQNQPLIKTNRGKACAFLHMAIADKSLEEIIHLCDALGLKEERYEEWSFMRDLETQYTLPTLVGGLAQVDMSFEWLVTDEYATEMKRREPCSVWGHGGLAPIPEEDESVGQRRVYSRPVRAKAKSKVVSIDKMDESDGHLSPVDVSRLIDSINLSVDIIPENLHHIPEHHEDEQTDFFQCTEDGLEEADRDILNEISTADHFTPRLVQVENDDINISPVQPELNQSDFDVHPSPNPDSLQGGKTLLESDAINSNSLFSPPETWTEHNDSMPGEVKTRAVCKEDLPARQASSVSLFGEVDADVQETEQNRTEDGLHTMVEPPADMPHLEMTQDFKDFDTDVLFSLRQHETCEDMEWDSGMGAASSETWGKEEATSDGNENDNALQSESSTWPALLDSSCRDEKRKTNVALVKDSLDREGGAARRDSDAHRSRDSGSAGQSESSNRSLRLLDEPPAFDPGLITTEEALGGGFFAKSNVCASCGAKVGTGLLGNARFCNYTRLYFCPQCHTNEKFFIISKVLKRWDFTPRNVSTAAKSYLQGIYDQPLFSAAMDVPPPIHQKVKQLEQIRNLRRKAKLLRDYVVQCSNFPNSRCQQEDRIAAVHLHEKDYLIADDDSLSLRDLDEIRNGKLKAFLESTIEPWIEHVMNRCLLCREKGYLCEICNSKEVVFPFELDKVTKCEKCNAICHSACAAKSRSCMYGHLTWSLLEEDDDADGRRCMRIQKIREKSFS